MQILYISQIGKLKNELSIDETGLNNHLNVLINFNLLPT